MIIHIPDFPTACVVSTFRASAPEGWLLLNGQTIGNALSGASARASNDTEALFLILWNDTNAEVVGGRGSTAAADFAAGKQLVLPDARKRVLAGLSDSDGWNVLGATLGAEKHALSLAEIPNHKHSLGPTGHFSQDGGTSDAAVVGNETQATSNVDPAVLGEAHSSVQPTLIANKIIKL